MKRGNIVGLTAFACFIFFCFYMRWKMERQLSSNLHNEIIKVPVRILNAVSDSVKKAADSMGSASQRATNDSAASPGGVIDDITSVLKKTVEPGGSATTNTNNPDLEGLGVRVLGAATETARKVDRIGLDATRMTDQQESQFGAEMAKSITNEFKIVPESPEYSRIARLMAPILDERKRQQIHYTFHIIDSKSVNAFSLAGGYIYITTAFLHEFPSDASLVMALAHEVGHVELRHCAEKVQYTRIGSEAIGDIAMFGGALYSTLTTPYTKDQEFAADEYGFLACRKAGWNAVELIALFTQLDAYERRKGISSEPSDSDSKLEIQLKNYFSSHPPTIERKQRLEKLEEK